MSTILIKNADWLVTMDAERRIITDGALLIENDRVVKVGKISAMKRTKADKVIDAAGKLVLPGLIDTHVHIGEELIALGFGHLHVGHRSAPFRSGSPSRRLVARGRRACRRSRCG